MTSDATTQTLRPLRQAFKDGKLEIVVGAGASQDAGLPSWDELARLHPEHKRSGTNLMQIADHYIQKFGRNEAIDVVRSRTRSKVFDSYLHDALYGAGPHDLRSIHYELATMLGAQGTNPRLFTFNYDNLLERATMTS